MANEFIARNGLIAQNNSTVTGSLTVTSGITGSLLGTSSWANDALTSSYLNTLNQDLTFNGNLTLNGTASVTYLNVTYESASVIYSSGSNQLGDDTNDTQTLIGRTIVTGSFEVTGSVNIPDLTGSLLGTASYANQALTASFALNGSADTGSLLTTASVSLNTITFTKGNGTTFPITVDTGSGGSGAPSPTVGLFNYYNFI